MESIIETPISSAVVEVFKTNVSDINQADSIMNALINVIPSSRINFDLQDCDKILRIESQAIDPDVVINIVTSHGYICEVLI
jgi:hypothetical protein